jgi:hypothetical protein
MKKNPVLTSVCFLALCLLPSCSTPVLDQDQAQPPHLTNLDANAVAARAEAQHILDQATVDGLTEKEKTKQRKKSSDRLPPFGEYQW